MGAIFGAACGLPGDATQYPVAAFLVIIPEHPAQGNEPGTGNTPQSEVDHPMDESQFPKALTRSGAEARFFFYHRSGDPVFFIFWILSMCTSGYRTPLLVCMYKVVCNCLHGN